MFKNTDHTTILKKSISLDMLSNRLYTTEKGYNEERAEEIT